MKRSLSIFIVSLCLTAASCSHLTVTPTPVAPHQTSSWAKQNILDADKTGVLVTAEWVRVYDALLKAYQDKLSVADRPSSSTEGIASEGANFRVTYVVQHRFADLKAIDRARP